ncbi:MAG: type II toxin-antitoxin system RelE/ParE family toxin [Oscillospiraceae bacterium]|nr:type II toxin-antitoxin system RelE/ParE family toxin [Oscillospiraceae bacterium]
MKLTYRPLAIADLRHIYDYIASYLGNVAAADRIQRNILKKAELLRENPEMGRLLSSKFDGLESNIRYMVVVNYLVFYSIGEKEIIVTRILDGRTDYLTELARYL